MIVINIYDCYTQSNAVLQIRELRNRGNLDIVGIAYEKPNWDLITNVRAKRGRECLLYVLLMNIYNILSKPHREDWRASIFPYTSLCVFTVLLISHRQSVCDSHSVA